MAEMPGLCIGMRMESGRLKDVQSRINWVRIDGGGRYWRIEHIGWTFDTSFMSSGKSLPLTSDVARHDTMTWSMESVGALHSIQAGLKVRWSMDILWFVRKSLVRNIKWRHILLASYIVEMVWRTAWGQPERPESCKLRYWIFEFPRDILLSSSSCQIVILVLIIVLQSSLDMGQ